MKPEGVLQCADHDYKPLWFVDLWVSNTASVCTAIACDGENKSVPVFARYLLTGFNDDLTECSAVEMVERLRQIGEGIACVDNGFDA